MATAEMRYNWFYYEKDCLEDVYFEALEEGLKSIAMQTESKKSNFCEHNTVSTASQNIIS